MSPFPVRPSTRRASGKRRALSIAVAVVLTAHEAAAQSIATLANVTIEELMRMSVTTATRMEESVANAPARIEVITADQIRRRGYRSLTDVLKDLVDFKVDLLGDPDYQANLAVQGARGSNLVIVLLDGIRISSPTNEPLPILANYPVHTAQQIEVVYGPSSAVYGADAFAAVVNVITKKGAESSGGSVETSFGQYGLYNQTVSYGHPIGHTGSFLLGAQLTSDRQPDLTRYYPADFGALEAQHTGVFNTIFGPMTSRRPVPSTFENPLTTRSLQASLSTGPFQALFFTNYLQASTAVPYTPDNAVYSRDAFARNTMTVGSLSYSRPIGQASSTSTVTVSRHELDPESGYWNVFSNLSRSYKYAMGSMVKADEQLTWKPTGRATLSAGGTFERFHAIPQTADLNAPVTSHDAPGTILDTTLVDEFIKLRYNNTGGYAQLRYGVTPAISLTLGARADYNSRFGATFNPRAGLVLRPAAMTTVKLLYGTAFLAPSPYESFAHYGSFYSSDGGATYASDYWHVGNADLKPQKKKTVEATFMQGLGGSFALSVSGFYSRVNDLIQGTDPDQAGSGTYLGWPVAYIDFPVNEGDATTYGGTVGLEFTRAGRSSRVHARVAMSAADGNIWHEDQENEPGYVEIGGMAPVQLRSTLDIDHGPWSFAPRLGVVGRQRTMATEQVGDALVRRTIDGFVIVDMTVRRRLSRSWDVFANVDNLFDARYRHINLRAYTNPEELVGAPQNPRRVSLGLNLHLR